jgi:hypothetical protein
MIYDPRYHTFDSWACLMVEQYAGQQLAIPDPSTDWREWGHRLEVDRPVLERWCAGPGGVRGLERLGDGAAELGDDMITVRYVPTQYVHKEWPLVAHFLEAALTHSEASGEITLDQLRSDLGQSRGALYTVTKDGALVGALSVTFQNQRNARVAFVTAIGGRGLG